MSTTASLSPPTQSYAREEDDDPTVHQGSKYQREMARANRRRGGGRGRFWKHRDRRNRRVIGGSHPPINSTLKNGRPERIDADGGTAAAPDAF